MNHDDSALCQMHRVGIPEARLIEFCKQFGDKNKIMIDGGAHMGSYSIMLSDYFKTVYAFEAQERTYTQLCGNIFINETTNVKPIHRALSSPENSSVVKELKIVSDDGGGSTLENTDEPVKHTEYVACTTLDLMRFDHVGLIKLDVEGHELSVLRGAVYTLERSGYPPILFESNDKHWQQNSQDELFNFLRTLNYKIGNLKEFPQMFLALQND